MPDYALWGQALLLSGVVAAVVLLLLAWPWRKPSPFRWSLGWTVGLGFGFYAGCAWLDLWPDWPISVDRDRFLLILLPLTLLAEIVAALPAGPSWLAWLPRLGLAAAAAPILLYKSTYLADLSGPHSAEWSTGHAMLILAGLATLLAGFWALLALLQARTSERTVSTILAFSCFGAGLTVMLWGYASGGLLGLALAGALAGATVASFVAPAPPKASCGLGVGIVGLFGVLLIGRFFGSLPARTALCLMLIPLLAWLPECPGLCRSRRSVRTGLRLLLVAGPLVFIVVEAKKQFEEAYGLRF